MGIRTLHNKVYIWNHIKTHTEYDYTYPSNWDGSGRNIMAAHCHWRSLRRLLFQPVAGLIARLLARLLCLSLS